MAYEIKYYSVGSPKKHLMTETRAFAFVHPESIQDAHKRLDNTIKSDIALIESFDRSVIMTTIRYCSPTSLAQFSEQLYTPEFKF